MTPPPPRSLLDTLANPYLLLVLTTLFWGLNVVVGRSAVGSEMPPVALTFWRWFLAILLLMPFAGPALWRQRSIVRRHWKILLLLSFLGVAVFNTMLYLALTRTSAVNASLINGIVPAATAFAAWILVRDRLSGLGAVGLAVSFAGVVVILARGDLSVLLGLQFNFGDMLMLPAIAAWAAYTALLRFRPVALDPLVFILVTFMVGILFVAVVYGFELSQGKTFAVNLRTLSTIGYVGLFPSLLAYVFWNRAVLQVGPNRASVFYYLLPVWGAVFGVLLLGEPFLLYHLAGIALIFAGVYVATGRRARGKNA